MIRSSPNTPLAVVVLGLDRFRHLNDLLGYQSGDEALREIGSRLIAWAPPGATVCRLGGDEFGIALPGSAEHASTLCAASVLHIFKSPFSLSQHELFLSASCGVSLSPTDSANSAALLRMASQAMARAKRRGGNSLERAAGSTGLRPEERYRLETALRFALERNELSLSYQPQVDREGRISCVEALLVWNHPEMGRIETETFIRLAEETGAIIPIGDWVLERACLQLAAWRADGLNPPRVAVNVSPVQFECSEFVPSVKNLLETTGLDGQSLELEVTEGTILRDLEESATRMKQLRALGVRIAIDDFGVGCSPLTYLHRLPLDVVKIDRTFVSQITLPSGSLPVVHTITVMAHHRGLQVVAEGVETPGQLELVRAARCDLVQGYLLGTPMTHQEIAGLMLCPERLSVPFRSNAHF